jgi:hypothetical protein
LAVTAFDRFVRGIRLINRLSDESSLSESVGNQQSLTRHTVNEDCGERISLNSIKGHINETACINTLCVYDIKVIGQAICKAIEPHADHIAACGS